MHVIVVTTSACTVAMLAPEPLAGPLKKSAWRAHPAAISETCVAHPDHTNAIHKKPYTLLEGLPGLPSLPVEPYEPMGNPSC